MKYNETAIEPLFDHLVIQQFGEGRFIEREPTPADIQAAHEGLENVANILWKVNSIWLSWTN